MCEGREMPVCVRLWRAGGRVCDITSLLVSRSCLDWPETSPVPPATAAAHIKCKTIQSTSAVSYRMLSFSQAYTHILTLTHTRTHTTLISPQPSTQLRGHNFWQALLSRPVERNVVFWGEEGPVEVEVVVVEGRGAELWSPLTALTGPRPLGPFHSSGSGYTASGPPLSPMMHIKYNTTHSDRQSTKNVSAENNSL